MESTPANSGGDRTREAYGHLAPSVVEPPRRAPRLRRVASQSPRPAVMAVGRPLEPEIPLSDARSAPLDEITSVPVADLQVPVASAVGVVLQPTSQAAANAGRSPLIRHAVLGACIVLVVAYGVSKLGLFSSQRAAAAPTIEPTGMMAVSPPHTNFGRTEDAHVTGSAALPSGTRASGSNSPSLKSPGPELSDARAPDKQVPGIQMPGIPASPVSSASATQLEAEPVRVAPPRTDGRTAAVIDVKADSPRMAAAVARARAELPMFWQHVAGPGLGETDFALKVALPTRSGSLEHIWAAIERRDADTILVRVSNDPVDVEGVALGSTVAVREAQITDWMFRRYGKIVGAHSLRALADTMPPSEAARYRAMLEQP